MTKRIRVFAPASVSNVGPGFDILGFPINGVGDEITVVKREQNFGLKITEADCPGFKLPKSINKNTAGVAAKALLKNSPKIGIEIRIRKNYGIGTGLGSSAASASGVVYAINKLLNLGYSKMELIQFAMEGENVASGNYHADNIAPSLLGGFTLVKGYNPLDIVKIKPKLKLFCGVISPKIKIETKSARALLKDTVPLKNVVTQCGNLAGMISALYDGSKKRLRNSLNDVIIEPQRAKLIPHFYDIKNKILDLGALGCSISGSGPAIFFFVSSREQGDKILNAAEKLYFEFGYETNKYLSSINYSGAKVIK